MGKDEVKLESEQLESISSRPEQEVLCHVHYYGC